MSGAFIILAVLFLSSNFRGLAPSIISTNVNVWDKIFGVRHNNEVRSLSVFAALFISALLFWGVKYLFTAGLGLLGSLLFSGVVLFWCINRDYTYSKQSILIEEHINLFTPLFWFAVVGPAGAWLYYTLFSVSSFNKTNRFSCIYSLFHWLQLIPALVTACVYSLVGDFDGGITQLKDLFIRKEINLSEVLLRCGNGALGDSNKIDEHDLVYRARLLWSLIAVFISIAYWSL